MMKYCLNPKTDKLHIINGCYYSKPTPPKEAKCFKTEDEAYKKEGRCLGHCKHCFKERD